MNALRLFVIAMSAGLLLAGAGCKSTEKTKIGEFDANDNEALKVAKGFADDILTGLKTDNYQLFSKNFTPEMKEKMTEKTFKATVKDMTERVGTLQSWSYLTVMEKAPLKAFVWKASFQKEIKDKDNKPVKLDTDMLFQLFIGKTDKGYVILIFAFQ
jgi:hypothetical protein